ncbi:MAG: PEP-CTERM sorting domain-containing protein [Akkermansiaceae bacterium]
MKHSLTNSLVITSLLATSLHGATIFGDVASATWETNTDWSGDVIPGTTTGVADVAGVNAARSLTLNSDASGAGTISNMTVANQNPGTGLSFFTMTSTAVLSATNLQIGANGSGGSFTYHDGASLSTSGSVLMGRPNDTNGTPASSEITFVLGTSGLTVPISTTTLNLRQQFADQKIIIDASAYTGGAADIDLITFTNHCGGDFNSVSVTGLNPALLSGAVSSDADSVILNLTVVPEPSSLALLALGSLGLIRRRR